MNRKEAIRKYIETELVKDKAYSNLKDDDQLIESGILDSLGIMKLLGYLEDEFSVMIEDNDLVPENFETLNTIASLAEAKVAC